MAVHEWVGELGSFEEHLSSCDFTLLPCPNATSTKKKWRNTRSVQDNSMSVPTARRLESTRREQIHTWKNAQRWKYFNLSKQFKDCGERMAHCEPTKPCEDRPFEIIPCKYACIGCEKEISFSE